jgi:uncharacterized protein
MRYNVAQLLKAKPGETREAELDDRLLFDEEGARLVAPIVGDLRLIRDHAGILVQGSVETRVSMDCSRCLAPVEMPVQFEIEEEFHPSVHIPGGPPVPPREEREDATQIDEHHVLDVSEVLRQDLATAIPWNVVCRPDCRGLCPVCGSDRNTEACECEPDVDPRWAALAALREENA